VLDPATAGERWALAGLSVLMAAWQLAFRRLGIDEQRPLLVLVYLAGLLGTWFVLAGIHPAFFTLLLVLYPQVFRHLRLSLAIPAAFALSMSASGGRCWRRAGRCGRTPGRSWAA
jgi:hypothetical protein